MEVIHCFLRDISHENTPCLVTSLLLWPRCEGGGGGGGNPTPRPVTQTLAPPEIFVSTPTQNIRGQEKYIHRVSTTSGSDDGVV